MSWSDNRGTFVESMFARLRQNGYDVVESAWFADACARGMEQPTWNELAESSEEFWVEQRSELIALPTCEEAA